MPKVFSKRERGLIEAGRLSDSGWRVRKRHGHQKSASTHQIIIFIGWEGAPKSCEVQKEKNDDANGASTIFTIFSSSESSSDSPVWASNQQKSATVRGRPPARDRHPQVELERSS